MLGWLSDGVVLVLEGYAKRREPALGVAREPEGSEDSSVGSSVEQADVPDSVRSLETVLEAAGTIGSRLFSYFHHLMGVRLAEPCLN